MPMMTPQASALRVVTRVADLETVRDAWEAVPWPRAEFDLDFFLVSLDAEADSDVQPYAVFVGRSELPVAAAVGQLETTALPAKAGYRTIYRPMLRVLTILPGGTYGVDEGAVEEVLTVVRSSLSQGTFDAVSLLGLPIGSPFHRRALALGGALRRQLFTPPQQHWRLRLPETYEEFLVSRSRSTRESVKRYGRRLEKTFGERLEIEEFRHPSDLDRIVHHLDRVAAKTYQAGLGVAFSDVEQQRRRVRLGLERGWFRAYVLYIDGEPIAFWHGYAYNRTFVIGIPGYDPAYADHRVGTYLQMRLIRDLCVDPDVDTIDYGRGDAEYKRRFGSDSEEEQDVVVFAPSVRGLTVNAVRNLILGSAQGARLALDAVGLSDRMKSWWRKALRPTPTDSRNA
jgi:hypothetical protein